MLIFERNASLKSLNTLALNSTASYLATVDSEKDLLAVLTSVTAKRLPVFILSGGSNVLLSEHIAALVIHPVLKGVRVLQETAQHVVVEVMAGEEWHPFVQYCIQQQWYGLENLSLIPGYVGAAPIQNIGAYGVEAGEYIESIRAWHIAGQRWYTLKPEQCHFGYRDSIFKQQAGQWVISRVTFRLNKQPKLVVSYGDVQQQAGRYPTARSVADAIISIRQSKLPDPKKVANAGSFFKNPTISATQFTGLKQQYPQLNGYPQGPDSVKVAAGWLIEQAGWKGKRIASVGMYEKQALVLVNHGSASLADVRVVSCAVQQDVQARFGILLEAEPVLVDF